jgi:hypothetical protein
MTDKPTLFNVLIDATGVILYKLEPGRRGYAGAKKNVILRERDAIKLFQDKKTRGDSFDGSYHFQSLQNAKTFALLRLKALEQGLEDNLDRIQTYDGRELTSGTGPTGAE